MVALSLGGDLGLNTQHSLTLSTLISHEILQLPLLEAKEASLTQAEAFVLGPTVFKPTVTWCLS